MKNDKIRLYHKNRLIEGSISLWKKRKQKLMKLYEDHYKEWFYYYDIRDYVGKKKDIYAKYIDDWKESVIKRTATYLSKKDSIENKLIFRALYALLLKDLGRFSVELSNVCRGRKKSRLFAENKFTKEISSYSFSFRIFIPE